MKYIIDIEALKNCFDLLPKPFITDGKACVFLDSIKEMIDIFPKEEYVENAKVYREFSNNVNKDILDGIGLKPIKDYVKATGKCPMCEDCPDNCPMEES